MVEISKVLKIADQRGLILIDELARGTNPKEGFALSKAIINYLKHKPSIVLLTTHLDGLADDEGILHLQVRALRMSISKIWQLTGKRPFMHGWIID